MKNKAALVAAAAAMLLISGCSWSNPFGIGYEHSVCESSKEFGVCGDPKSILRYKEKIKEVQRKYLVAGLKQRLYFGVDDRGNILVKRKRKGKWSFYETSKWKKLIESKYKKKMDKLEAHERKSRKAAPVSYSVSDIPVTEGSDLSVAYRKQPPLLVTRTSVGDIIRDAGRIQKVFIANYVDPQGDLVASHEVYVVVKDPEWVVGEKTPKKSYIEGRSVPTPLSTDLLKKREGVDRYSEGVVGAYVYDNVEGVAKAVSEDPSDAERTISEDKRLIREFLNRKDPVALPIDTNETTK
jgi:hypothetical protein